MNENRTTHNAPSHGNGRGETLAGVAVGMVWPTPKAHDAKAPGLRIRNSDSLTEASVRGLQHETTPTDGPNGSPPADLNPRFVEALMGVPQGWLTPCTSVETASYLRWLRLHSLSSHDEQACA
jgi:hypothetical protein